STDRRLVSGPGRLITVGPPVVPVFRRFPKSRDATSAHLQRFRVVATGAALASRPGRALPRIAGGPASGRTTMLRIERSVRGDVVVFAVSGRVGVKNITELQRIVDSEAARRKALNLKDLTLVDRHAVGFLARCEAEGTPLENCPIYVRQWIVREGPPSSFSDLRRKETFGMNTMHETSGTEERTAHQGDDGSSAADFHGIVGRSAALQRVLRLVETVATTDAAVVIRGETGTGKELIAGLIHRLSGRRGGPLV